jgi:hypothetical protein
MLKIQFRNSIVKLCLTFINFFWRELVDWKCFPCLKIIPDFWSKSLSTNEVGSCWSSDVEEVDPSIVLN